jgi:hypothetical protein
MRKKKNVDEEEEEWRWWGWGGDNGHLVQARVHLVHGQTELEDGANGRMERGAQREEHNT